MPDQQKVRPVSVGVAAGLSIIALLFYAIQLAALSDLTGSDAAGNAYAQAYAAIALILLWLLLGSIALIAFFKGEMPRWAAIAGFILIPASGFVSFDALEMLSHPYLPPHLWPIVVPAGAPPLIIAFCFWALLPSMRTLIPAPVASGAVWGTVFILCASMTPLQKIRGDAANREAAKVEKFDADYATLPADAPLWDWVPFLDTPNTTKSTEVLARIRGLERRQADAELMLDRGDFPLGQMSGFDLTPTQTICDKTRALLRKQVAALIPQIPNSKPFGEVRMQTRNAVSAMTWLVGYECSCDAESQAWQAMADAYRDPGFETVELTRLRDPKELGRTLREYPARFSMLSPKSHLGAWLKYADDKSLRAQALEGARKLDHRTADAVEMLRESEYSGWPVLKYLPVLDLETTPSLCGYALKAVQNDFTKVYRPKADDPPRPYSELLERLGAYEPLTAFVWLAGHGCPAEPELTDAEAMVRAYQDSPARVAMLAKLGQLHRKP